MATRTAALAVMTLIIAGCVSETPCICVTTEGGTQEVEKPAGLTCQGVADVQPSFQRCSLKNDTDIMAPFVDDDLQVSTRVTTSEAGWLPPGELVMLGS